MAEIRAVGKSEAGPVVFHLELGADGRMAVNVPKDAAMCLKMVSHFLMHISDYVQMKQNDSRIVIPKVVVRPSNGR